MVELTTGRDPKTGRALLLRMLVSPGEFPQTFTVPSPYFVAMLICDATRLRDTEITDLSRKLINAGCAYLCCWGADYERVHDLFDAEWIEDGFDPESSDTIMTTWHTDDSLDDFIQYAVWFTEPTEKYRPHCNSVVALVIDDPTAADRLREVLRTLLTFRPLASWKLKAG